MRCECLACPTEWQVFEKASIEWAESAAVGLRSMWAPEGDPLSFYIEMIVVPEVLATYARDRGRLIVTQIAKEGVTFFLENEEEPRRFYRTMERKYGHVFVPMSNIACINFFGPLRRSDVGPDEP